MEEMEASLKQQVLEAEKRLKEAKEKSETQMLARDKPLPYPSACGTCADG